MTDSIFALVTTYGYFGVFICAYLSCLLVPVPTSLMMLAGGALAASGDISAPILIVAAFIGAVLGDQTGYLVGRKFGRRALTRLARSPARARVIARAEKTVDERGGIGVFFSTWFVAPLGPYVNVAAGAGGLRRYPVGGSNPSFSAILCYLNQSLNYPQWIFGHLTDNFGIFFADFLPQLLLNNVCH